MRNGDESRIVKGEGDGRNRLDTSEETINELVLANIKDLRGEYIARIIDLNNCHSVCERGNVQHVEEGGFGWANTSTRSDDLDVRNNLNGTTGNLGGNTKGLEERCLSRFHTSVASRNENILGGIGTSTGRCSDFVGNDSVTNIREIFRSKDETDIILHIWQETFEFRRLREIRAYNTANHGVLSHQDNTLATEGNTDLMHLVRTNVVHIYNEDGTFTPNQQQDS